MFKNLSTPNQLYHSEAQHPNAMNVAQMQKKKKCNPIIYRKDER